MLNLVARTEWLKLKVIGYDMFGKMEDRFTSHGLKLEGSVTFRQNRSIDESIKQLQKSNFDVTKLDDEGGFGLS